MSRIGKQPVEVPSGVTVTSRDQQVIVSGPGGSLGQPLLAGLKLQMSDGQAVLTRASDEAAVKARHGLMRSLLQNMVRGVSQGFEKKLEINGVGYRVALAGNDLKLSLGFSHEVVYRLPSGVTATIDQNVITISGADKQQVGEVAAQIRALKKPEPYKGKGIKYLDERILRKSGKSGKEQQA